MYYWAKKIERDGERKEEKEGDMYNVWMYMYMYSTLLTISASLIAASSSLPIIIK